jgi:PAS domain S-box-containing protein
MNLLDLRTILFTNLITNCLCVSVLGFLWIQNRKRFAGLFYWVADYCFQAISLIMIFLRGFIPDWISLVLPNILVITGAFLGYVGLERFFGKQSRQIHNYVLLIIFTCLQIQFVFIAPDLSARKLITSTGVLILCAQCVWLITYRVSSGMRRLALGTGMVFGGFCLVSLVRIAVIIASPGSDNDFFKSDLYDLLMISCYEMLLILLSYSLILMVNGRLHREIHTQEEKFSKAFHSSPYSLTITRLSDGHFIEINDGFLKISGYGYDEVIGKSSVDLNLWENDADRRSVVDELSRKQKVREAEYRFRKKTGETIIGLYSAEIIVIDDNPWILSVTIDISLRKEAEREREKLIGELKYALSEVKQLSGLLPICSYCKKIRDDQGYWNQIEAYISDHSRAEFSHSICTECAEKHFPGMNLHDA